MPNPAFFAAGGVGGASECYLKDFLIRLNNPPSSSYLENKFFETYFDNIVCTVAVHATTEIYVHIEKFKYFFQYFFWTDCPFVNSPSVLSIQVMKQYLSPLDLVADYSEYRFPGLVARLMAACCQFCEKRLTGLGAALKAACCRCCECRLPRLGAGYKWFREKLKTLMFLGTALKGLYSTHTHHTVCILHTVS